MLRQAQHERLNSTVLPGRPPRRLHQKQPHRPGNALEKQRLRTRPARKSQDTGRGGRKTGGPRHRAGTYPRTNRAARFQAVGRTGPHHRGPPLICRPKASPRKAESLPTRQGKPPTSRPATRTAKFGPCSTSGRTAPSGLPRTATRKARSTSSGAAAWKP